MKARSPKLSLFALMCVATGVLMLFGWLATSIVGAPNIRFIGALFGGFLGTVLAGILASRAGLVQAADESVVTRLALAGFFAGMLAGSAISENEAIISIVAIPGAGLGALLGRYVQHFFDYEPPQRLL